MSSMACWTSVFVAVMAEFSALREPLMLLSMDVTRSWFAPVIGQGHWIEAV